MLFSVKLLLFHVGPLCQSPVDHVDHAKTQARLQCATGNKRQKSVLPTDQGNVCSSDVSHDDQENQQQPLWRCCSRSRASCLATRQATTEWLQHDAGTHLWVAAAGLQLVQQQRLDCAGLIAGVSQLQHSAEEASGFGRQHHKEGCQQPREWQHSCCQPTEQCSNRTITT